MGGMTIIETIDWRRRLWLSRIGGLSPGQVRLAATFHPPGSTT